MKIGNFLDGYNPIKQICYNIMKWMPCIEVFTLHHTYTHNKYNTPPVATLYFA